MTEGRRGFHPQNEETGHLHNVFGDSLKSRAKSRSSLRSSFENFSFARFDCNWCRLNDLGPRLRRCFFNTVHIAARIIIIIMMFRIGRPNSIAPDSKAPTDPIEAGGTARYRPNRFCE